MRRTRFLLLSAFVLAGAAFAPNAEAQVCSVGEEANLRWSLHAFGRDAAQGPATVEYTILSETAACAEPPVDDCESLCDPTDVDCLDACEEPPVDDCESLCDPTDVDCLDACAEPPVDDCEAVETTGSFEVPLESSFEIALPAGEAEFIVELDGHEPLLLDRWICGEMVIRATLLPNAPTTLTVHATTWRNEASIEGAVATLHGVDEREGERFEATFAADGTIVFEGVLPGFYALDILLDTGDSLQRVGLPFVDVLGEGIVSVRLRSSLDLPEARSNCASTESMSSSWLVIALGAGILALRRRRTHA